MESPYSNTYWQYLQDAQLELGADVVSLVASRLESTSWEEPQLLLDSNNNAVVALIEAEQSEALSMREAYLQIALELLNSTYDRHPLCAAHLALLYSLIGETEKAIQIAFSTLMNVLQPAFANETAPPGLIYLPAMWQERVLHDSEGLSNILAVENAYQQSVYLLGKILWRSQSIFYNPTGQRLLQVAAQLSPDSAPIQLRLGIGNLMTNHWEGLVNLHRANQLLPGCGAILQSLYLAYTELNQSDAAAAWLEAARQSHLFHPEALEWHWTQMVSDHSVTCVPFEADLLLVVESNLRSIVTGVLLGAGDWFERELEFWRQSIQPGMTVIDVGANVGVYTFSAAHRVGSGGRVVAIEPFSGCVRCLQETCRLNQIDWVSVCRGAASNFNGTARLSLHAASELNQLITTDSDSSNQAGPFEEVPCFSLDSVIETEELTQVDFLKIDAEGHELQVLMGSDRLLTQFAPIILYENIAGGEGSNLPVAEFLSSRHYQLFRYQPYLHQLIAIESTEDLRGSLNIIAVPPDRLSLLNA